MTNPLFQPFTLPNGVVLPNRLVKSAMAENMAGTGQLPDEKIFHLYQRFAQGGVGLMITGNVMVDDNGVSTAGDVVLMADTPLAPFKQWAKTAQQQGGKIIMQINHPGRQAMAGLGKHTYAPSAIGVNLGKYNAYFVQPQAMNEQEIQQTIQRFAETAKRAEQAGFDGVQIHAAHGYLISQFLSPLANQRQDKWGGDITNRARFLLEIVDAVRAVVSPQFIVAIKLNSADFQRGGFSQQDAQQVIAALNHKAIDFVELSGGNYESPSLLGEKSQDNSTLAREAYFLEFAKDMQKTTQMPLMTTGGIRRQAVAEQVLKAGMALVGMATALALNPNLPQQWQQGNAIDGARIEIDWQDKMLRSTAIMMIVQRQLLRLATGKPAGKKLNPIWTLILSKWRQNKKKKRYQQWLAKR